MLRRLAIIIGAITLFVYVFGCGDDLKKVEDAEPHGHTIPTEVFSAINNVLNQYQEGYENGDVETYMGVFWSQGFRYVADMGTEGDKTDDLEFDDIREEQDAATRIFNQFQDITLVLSTPPEIYIDMDNTRAEVRNHYQIHGYVGAGESFQGEYSGWFAEGDNRFIFEKRDDEWRIVEWYDEAYNVQDIQIENEELLPIIWSTLKQTQ